MTWTITLKMTLWMTLRLILRMILRMTLYVLSLVVVTVLASRQAFLITDVLALLLVLLPVDSLAVSEQEHERDTEDEYETAKCCDSDDELCM